MICSIKSTNISIFVFKHSYCCIYLFSYPQQVKLFQYFDRGFSIVKYATDWLTFKTDVNSPLLSYVVTFWRRLHICVRRLQRIFLISSRSNYVITKIKSVLLPLPSTQIEIYNSTNQVEIIYNTVCYCNNGPSEEAMSNK